MKLIDSKLLDYRLRNQYGVYTLVNFKYVGILTWALLGIRFLEVLK